MPRWKTYSIGASKSEMKAQSGFIFPESRQMFMKEKIWKHRNPREEPLPKLWREQRTSPFLKMIHHSGFDATTVAIWCDCDGCILILILVLYSDPSLQALENLDALQFHLIPRLFHLSTDPTCGPTLEFRCTLQFRLHPFAVIHHFDPTLISPFPPSRSYLVQFWQHLGFSRPCLICSCFSYFLFLLSFNFSTRPSKQTSPWH